MSNPLARRTSLDLETFARAAGVHPELARRLVTLGLLEAMPGAAGELWFARDQIRVAARVRRLHDRLALNYASIGLVAELLDRIAELERANRAPLSTGGRQWN
jgi:chaperone modulatory protein CbpM